MKESPRRYINPFLSDEENDEVNFTTNLDDGKFEKSLEPSNVPLEALEKSKELYIDKNVTECQIPDSGFHVVKDICVDEGLSHEEMIKCDEAHHKLSCDPVNVNGDKHDDMIKDDLETDCYKNSCLISATEDDNVTSNKASDEIKLFLESNNVNSSEDFGPDKAMQIGEEEVDSSSNSLNSSINVLEPSDNGVNDANQQLSEAQSVGSESNEPRETSDTVDPPNEIKMDENTTPDSANVKPTTDIGPGEPLPDPETQYPPNHHPVALNSITVAARGGGESSFSMADPVSGHITYSGAITSCGSISHRSDGSNSSVRSFAFPILQNEWNSSPVRMVKPDRKQSRKHRGWRQAIMCCRF